jgi:hypothetical protein
MDEVVQQEQPTKRKIVPDAEFVQKWQSAESAQAVADDLGLQRASVNARACGLREKGVRLKKFARAPAFGRQPRDESYYADLAALAGLHGDLCPEEDMPTDEKDDEAPVDEV